MGHCLRHVVAVLAHCCRCSSCSARRQWRRRRHRRARGFRAVVERLSSQKGFSWRFRGGAATTELLVVDVSSHCGSCRCCSLPCSSGRLQPSRWIPRHGHPTFELDNCVSLQLRCPAGNFNQCCSKRAPGNGCEAGSACAGASDATNADACASSRATLERKAVSTW